MQSTRDWSIVFTSHSGVGEGVGDAVGLAVGEGVGDGVGGAGVGDGVGAGAKTDGLWEPGRCLWVVPLY